MKSAVTKKRKTSPNKSIKKNVDIMHMKTKRQRNASPAKNIKKNVDIMKMKMKRQRNASPAKNIIKGGGGGKGKIKRTSIKNIQDGGSAPDPFVKNMGGYTCIKSQSIKDIMNAVKDIMINDQ